MIRFAVMAYRLIPRPLRTSILRWYARLPSSLPVLDRAVAAIHRRSLTGELAARGVPLVTGVDPADTRQRLHQHIVGRHITGPVELLEFGVFDGTSLRWWRANLPPGSRVVGFDSFHGLPARWNDRHPAGAFDRGGVAPQFGDESIELIAGLFEETLAGFLDRWTRRFPVVVHLDADLYSSTAFVLRSLRGRIGPRPILVFDEFWDIRHEHRAFDEFCERGRLRYEFLAVTNAQAAVRLE